MRVQAEQFEVYCSTTVTEIHVSFQVQGIALAKYRECILNYPKLIYSKIIPSEKINFN